MQARNDLLNLIPKTSQMRNMPPPQPQFTKNCWTGTSKNYFENDCRHSTWDLNRFWTVKVTQVFDSTDRLVVYEVQHLARISPGPMLSKTLADESQGEWSSAISPPYPAAPTCHDK